jgi:single stranded DNA-binding protein
MDYQNIHVVLIGNATQDAAVKQAKESGKPYGDFRLAVRNRTGETTYFPIRCFGKLAASVTTIKKGTKLFVEGELEISSFEGAEGGKRMTFRVVATTYRLLGNGHRPEEDQPAAAQGRA